MSIGQIKLLFIIVAAALLAFVTAQNAAHTSSLNFFCWKFDQVPTVFIILFSLLLGSLVMFIERLVDLIRRKRHDRDSELDE